MTYRDTITITKPWAHVEASNLPFAGLFAKLKNAVTMQIPIGYQDESGFHTGVKPDGQDIQWPAKW